MRIWKIIVFGFIMVSFIGCLSSEFFEEFLLKVYFEVNKYFYKIKVGIYCWKEMCVDKVGFLELLKIEKLIEVKVNELLLFVIKYKW